MVIKAAPHAAGKAAGPAQITIITTEAPSWEECCFCSRVRQVLPFKNDCSALNDIFGFLLEK